VNARRVLHSFIDISWAAFLICLPFTSFPLFEKYLGSIVSPLSAVPLLFLILAWFIPYILNHGKIPRESLPLILFTLAAVASSALAFFIDVPSLKGKNVPDQEIRALLTLALGLAFYLTVASFPKDGEHFNKTLRWIHIGGVILILWSLGQVYFMIFKSGRLPDWYLQLQGIVSSKTPGLKYILYRLTGLAYEASWVSLQLMILYIPLWLSSTVQSISVFKVRLLRLTVENILLIAGFIIFFFTSPRISLIGLFLVGVFLFWKINQRIHHVMMQWLDTHWHISFQRAAIARTGLAVALGIAMFLLYFSAAFLCVYTIGQHDSRVGLLFKHRLSGEDIKGLVTFNEATYINIGFQFAFGERVTYWLTSFNVFSDYPWFGVGLGDTGFFFPEKMPAVGLSSVEIRTLLYKDASLPNSKSLWFRLLSETGLVGFSLFVSWLVLLWRSAAISTNSENRVSRLIALAGQFSLLAFIAEGLSIDSFAMPYLWIMAGLISAIGAASRRQVKQNA
jgi:hypothetical protein